MTAVILRYLKFAREHKINITSKLIRGKWKYIMPDEVKRAFTKEEQKTITIFAQLFIDDMTKKESELN